MNEFVSAETRDKSHLFDFAHLIHLTDIYRAEV